MATVFLLHGSYGNPEESWFPWLRDELAKAGHGIIIPRFPTPEGQTLESWNGVMSSHLDALPGSVLIGHSLGATFALHLLERAPARAAFLVAGLIREIGNPYFDTINRTFIEHGFKWDAIRKNCLHFSVFHSDNDPYVPLPQAQDLAANLGTVPTIVRGAGHFNANSGFTTFPQLLEAVLKAL